jgi:hypothetical protein
MVFFVLLAIKGADCMIDLQTAQTNSTIKTWVDFLKTADIPVLKETARQIGALKENEEQVCTRDITAVVTDDPMMVFKILCYSQQHKGAHQLQDLVQVEQALLMMGTGAFFNQITPEPLVEDVLNQDFSALMDLLKIIVRAHRAAHFAAEFAALRKDLHAEEVRIAALLHDLAEMLLWCFDTEKMNTILHLQELDKTLRSKAVQEKVLGFKISDLQKEIAIAFQLPALLQSMIADEEVNDPRIENVRVAVNLARHSANGWNDAALPDDYKEIADLLHIDVARAKRIIGAP